MKKVSIFRGFLNQERVHFDGLKLELDGNESVSRQAFGLVRNKHTDLRTAVFRLPCVDKRRDRLLESSFLVCSVHELGHEARKMPSISRVPYRLGREEFEIFNNEPWAKATLL